MNTEAFGALQDILFELWPYSAGEEIRRFGCVVTEDERIACIRSLHGPEGVRMYHAVLRGLHMLLHPNALIGEAGRLGLYID
ncbi:MAG: hypothetical protein WAN46_07905 [Gammaproteobacteria bacterium]